MTRPLDRIDRSLVDLLQNNARYSNKELAAAVDLAPSSCLARVRRLIDEGVLTGFHARVDPMSVGIDVQAVVAVRLAHHARDQVDSFREYIATCEEVIAVYHLTGRWDYLVHVAARDLAHLRRIALSVFTNRAEVDHIETSVLFEHFAKPGLPLYPT
jgi:DNA-binding Lrp family transcriptional regulator